MNNADITNKEKENDIEVEDDAQSASRDEGLPSSSEENNIIWPSAKLLKDDKKSLNK